MVVGLVSKGLKGDEFQGSWSQVLCPTTMRSLKVNSLEDHGCSPVSQRGLKKLVWVIMVVGLVSKGIKEMSLGNHCCRSCL
jgi:hypothetical protein